MDFYRGVVEDNLSNGDGKVRVRILGIHSEDKTLVKTEELPWAEVMGSLGNAGSGLGLTQVPVVGTWVFLVLDQGDINHPIIVGTMGGMSVAEADTSVGFNDPSGEIPKADRLNEYDTNRLTRVENLDKTIHKTINDNKIDYEPDSTNDKSVYPDNTVYESKSGHVIEIDDSKDNERIRVFHKSGSYVEFKPDGDIVVHTEKDDYQLVRGQAKIQVLELMTIDAKGKLLINGNVKIDGNVQVTEKISGNGGVTSGAEVADAQGNLSSLRQTYDSHFHTGNLGYPTSAPITSDTLSRDGDYTW